MASSSSNVIIGTRPKRIMTADIADELLNPSKDIEQHLSATNIELFRDPQSPLTAQGTYVVKSKATGKHLGVFKPTTEEAAMQTRRKLSISHVIKQGIVTGDAAIKERAAFILDIDGLAGVPKTDIVVIDGDGSAAGDYRGSLQEFCEHMCTSEDLGPSKYDFENVHAIALLDLRLFNLDRHVGNLLVRSGAETGTYRLVPIDHGFSLPSFRTLSDAMFCWSDWRQAKLPFSDRTMEYITRIQPVRHIVPLKRIGLRDECIMTYVICTMFVQACSQSGRTLYEMASAMQRDLYNEDSISAFETLVQKSSHDAAFDDFIFGDDRDSSWSSANVQNFLDVFERNLKLVCIMPSCRETIDSDPLLPTDEKKIE